MVWSWPILDSYWSAVLDNLNLITNLTLEPDLKLLLLIVFDSQEIGRYTKLFLGYATYALTDIFSSESCYATYCIYMELCSEFCSTTVQDYLRSELPKKKI